MIKLKNKDTLYSIIICAITIGPSINYYLNELIQFVLGGRSISSFIYIVLAVMGVMAYPLLSKQPKNNKVSITIVASIVLLLLSAVIHPSIWKLIISDDFNPLSSIGLFLFFFGFPLLILCSKHKEWDLLLKYLFYFSIADIALAAMVYFYVMIPVGTDAVSYMSFSYSQLFPGAVCAVYGYRNKRIIPFIISFFSLILIFLGGARGSLGCMLLVYALLALNNLSLRNAGLFLAVLLLAFYFGPRLIGGILSSSQQLVDELGGFSRTLYLISEGDFFVSKGRDNISVILKDAIYYNPLGYGLLGDRYVLAQHGNTGYAHNIVLEFLCDFGWFFGVILLISLFIMVVRVFLRQKKTPLFYCFLAMFPAGFVMLFMSGSFLEEFVFWAFLGVLYNASTIKNKPKTIKC